MRIGRFLTIFLVIVMIGLGISSCKRDSTMTNQKTENDTSQSNLLQNEPVTKSDTDIVTNIEPPINQISGNVIENTQEKIQKNTEITKKPKASNEVIFASPEFKAFMDAVFTLSDESTTEELNYVNSFMDKNSLWKEMQKDQCNLLNNENIKSDPKVFHFWEKRCNFNKAQNKVVKKYNISYDALGKLMQQKRGERQYNPDLAVPDNE
ncbi:MAG: hypothetical protein IPH57_07365 [Saprospiraceae bacterium]|nr:hypothetical protein [Saprospiraceae bacterium]